MRTPDIVSAAEWEAAREQLLVREKELTRARDALTALRATPVPEGQASAGT